MKPLTEGLLDTAGPGSATVSTGLVATSLFAVMEGDNMTAIFIGITGIVTAIGSVVASIYSARTKASRENNDEIIRELRELVVMLKSELHEARDQIRELHRKIGGDS